MRPFFMSYVRGEDRGQGVLLPSALEDYVTADGPVRVIDAFVDGLDVSGLGFGRAAPAGTGRPPYDPRDLLKLYVYGYLNEVRSSRRLERECGRNVEVMSLLRRLAPDFKTIADFRRDNGAAIVGACRAFVLFCRDQGLFRARLVALDGSKFRAAASPKRIMGRREIVEEAARLDRRIADYLAGLDESDAREPDEAPQQVQRQESARRRGLPLTDRGTLLREIRFRVFRNLDLCACLVATGRYGSEPRREASCLRRCVAHGRRTQSRVAVCARRSQT
jgi:transposase